MASGKSIFYLLEALNAFGATYFISYLFFLARQGGGSDLSNLLLAALHGLVYTFAAWFGGRFAERRGYVGALRLGFVLMAAVLAAGFFLDGLPELAVTLAAWTFSMCFTWPALEAVLAQGEDRAGTHRRMGLYNLVWSFSSAAAFFAGGALFEAAGRTGLFLFPIALHLVQIAILDLAALRGGPAGGGGTAGRGPPPAPPALRLAPSEAHFLRLAWIANPFAYMAINTVVALVPRVAERFDLTPLAAGVFCSIWMFARFLAFGVLYAWSGWTYRRGLLLASYGALIAGFALVLLSPWGLAVAAGQALFGLAIGLIYSSSLFYAMDAGEAKGEHGGIHEAAIGAGFFGGPAVGAAAMALVPAHAPAGPLAVCGLLVVGGALLVAPASARGVNFGKPAKGEG